MNTNINEKINNEMDMDQLENVNGGWIAEVLIASALIAGVPTASWAISRSISRKVHSGNCK